MRFVVGASVCAFLLASGPAALACEGKVVLLEDHFENLSPIWDSTIPVNLVDGKVEMKSKSGKSDKMIANPLYKEVDFCADVSVVAGSNLPAIYVGLGFWFTDYQNLYAFQLTPDGYAGVYRLKDGKWDTVLKDAQSSSLKTGRDEVNTLRVVTAGDKATLYINGDQFDEITGDPPSDGQHVGFVGQASDQSAATYRFDDVSVTVPETDDSAQ